MLRQKSPNQSDLSLLHFLRATSASESDDILARLVAEQTETTIKGVIRNKLRVSLSNADNSQANQDALDLLRDVQASLVAELRGLRSNDDGKVIGNLRGYVTSVTFNACHQYLRRKYPRRHQLKNKLRYLLTHRPGLVLWEHEGGEWVCGLEAWRKRGLEPLIRSQVQTLQEQDLKGVDGLRVGESADERATATADLPALTLLPDGMLSPRRRSSISTCALPSGSTLRTLNLLLRPTSET